MESARVVAGELDLPHLVELPARGPSATMTPRTAALLTELYVDLQPHGWRFVPRPGRDHGRAQAFLRNDLDAFEEAVQGHDGPVKVQVCGPWTLAATLDRTLGDKSLGDPGACRDIADSLADGLAGHVAEVARRTGCDVVVQVDEPLLPAVVAGEQRTASGWGRLRRPEEPEVLDLLGRVLAAGGRQAGVHCCASDAPVRLLRRAGATWLGLDLTLAQDEEGLAEALEAGLGLHAGLVDPLSDPAGTVVQTVAPLRALWSRTGLEAARLAQVTVAPTCGLAGTRDPRPILTRCRDAAEELDQ